MKGFFLLFSDSAKELKHVRTLTVTGIMIALALVLKLFTINLGGDLKIGLGFIPICVIAMLYGPVVCSMSALAIDFLGFFVENNAGQAYYPPIALVAILGGIVYGIFLYRKNVKLINIICAKSIVNIFLNLGLNSYFVYTGFVNRSFDIFNSSDLKAIFTWMVVKGRVAKNIIALPLEVIALIAILPVARKAFDRIIRKTA